MTDEIRLPQDSDQGKEKKEHVPLSPVREESLLFLVHNLQSAPTEDQPRIIATALDKGAYYLLLTHFKLLDDATKQRVAQYFMDQSCVPALLMYQDELGSWVDWDKLFNELEMDGSSYKRKSPLSQSQLFVESTDLQINDDRVDLYGRDYEFLFRYRKLFPDKKPIFQNYVNSLIQQQQVEVLLNIFSFLEPDEQIPWGKFLPIAMQRKVRLELYEEEFCKQYPQHAQLMTELCTHLRKHGDGNLVESLTQRVRKRNRDVASVLISSPLNYERLAQLLPELLIVTKQESRLITSLDWNTVMDFWILARPTHQSDDDNYQFRYLLPHLDLLAKLPIDWDELVSIFRSKNTDLTVRCRISVLLKAAGKLSLLSAKEQGTALQQAYISEQAVLDTQQSIPPNELVTEDEVQTFLSLTLDQQTDHIVKFVYSNQFRSLIQYGARDPRVLDLLRSVLNTNVSSVEWQTRLQVLLNHGCTTIAEDLLRLLKLVMNSEHTIGHEIPPPKTRESFSSFQVLQRATTFYLDQLLLSQLDTNLQHKQLEKQKNSKGLAVEPQEYANITDQIREQTVRLDIQQRVQKFAMELKEYVLCAVDEELRGQINSSIFSRTVHEPERAFSPSSKPIFLEIKGQELFVNGASSEEIRSYLLAADSFFMSPRWTVINAGKEWSLITNLGLTFWKDQLNSNQQIVAIDQMISIQHKRGNIFDKDCRVIEDSETLQALLDFRAKVNTFDELLEYIRAKHILTEEELVPYMKSYSMIQSLTSSQTPTRAAGYE